VAFQVVQCWDFFVCSNHIICIVTLTIRPRHASSDWGQHFHMGTRKWQVGGWTKREHRK
jgi:hypothetical protein